MNDLEKSIIVATEAHGGTLDKGGIPYILHPMRVALNIEKECRNQGMPNKLIWEIMSVAMLHDVIEDTKITDKELKEYGFSKVVRSAVSNLTRLPNQSYNDYIFKVIESNDIRTLMVKYYDLIDNQDVTRLKNITTHDLLRNNKYANAARDIYPKLQLLINKHRK